MKRAERAQSAAVVTAQANSDTANAAFTLAQLAFDASSPDDYEPALQALSDTYLAVFVADDALVDAKAILVLV